MSKESKHTIKVIHWTAKEDYGEGGKGGRDRNGEREGKRWKRERGRRGREKKRDGCMTFTINNYSECKRTKFAYHKVITKWIRKIQP